VIGDLRDETGRRSASFTVCAIPINGGVVRVRDKVCSETDEQGKFVINLAQAGTYQIMSERMSEGYMPAYIPLYSDPRVTLPEVCVSVSIPNASISLTHSPKSGIIKGKVIDEVADTPIQDFIVWVWDPRDPRASYREAVKGGNRFQLFAPIARAF